MEVDVALEHPDFAVVDLDQVSQRLDTDRVVAAESHLVELDLTGGTEHVDHRRQHTSLAITAWTCAFSPERSCTSLAR